MTKVIANMSVSLDGFVADPHHGVGHLFGYAAGDVEVPDQPWPTRRFAPSPLSPVAQRLLTRDDTD